MVFWYFSGFSKSAIVLGAGALLYLNYIKKDQFHNILQDVGSALQYYGRSVFTYLNGTSTSDTAPPEKDTLFQMQNNYTNITNQWLNCTAATTTNTPFDDSIDLSSITFSSLNSIGSSTVAKFDYLLDQVQQIKDCMDDSYCELHGFQSPSCSHVRNERRLSDGEMTMPSLEWDLGDTPLDQENLCDDGFHHFGGKKQSFLYNVKYNGIIDGEVLSQFIFNKDFDFKDRIYDRMNVKSYFASLRHQLKSSSMATHRSIDAARHRVNRDSAFFEED